MIEVRHQNQEVRRCADAVEKQTAVEDLNAICKSTLDHINREIAPEKHVTIAGGWIHNPMVYAEKVIQFGEFEIVNVPEAGAMGAAEFAGVALGEISRR